VGDKVKSEFKVNRDITWYNREVLKVNLATYKVKFLDSKILNIKKNEVVTDQKITIEDKKAVTTPDNKREPKIEVKPKVKPKVITAKNIKENDRIAVY
jgi:hypothetical protein